LTVPIVEGNHSLNASQRVISPTFQHLHDRKSSNLKHQFEELQSVNTFGFRHDHAGLQMSPRQGLLHLKACDFADIKNRRMNGSSTFKIESPHGLDELRDSPRWVEIYKQPQLHTKHNANRCDRSHTTYDHQAPITINQIKTQISNQTPDTTNKSAVLANYNQDLMEFLQQAHEKKFIRKRKSHTSSCNKSERQLQAITEVNLRLSQEESTNKNMSQHLPSRPSSYREGRSKPSSHRAEDK